MGYLQVLFGGGFIMNYAPRERLRQYTDRVYSTLADGVKALRQEGQLVVGDVDRLIDALSVYLHKGQDQAGLVPVLVGNADYNVPTGLAYFKKQGGGSPTITPTGPVRQPSRHSQKRHKRKGSR